VGFVVVRIFLNHLGEVCVTRLYEYSLIILVVFVVVRMVLNHLGEVGVTRWYE
jgi:demethoxyubiquinone hydroxylase (CLK1/Coq7/Cat5 family)